MVKETRIVSDDNFTLKELLVEQRNDMKEILEKTSQMAEHLKTLNGRVAKTEDRVAGNEAKTNDLDAFRWKVTGALLLLSILASYLMSRLFG
jgi:predicted nuclease with TOPRIM domain